MKQIYRTSLAKLFCCAVLLTVNIQAALAGEPVLNEKMVIVAVYPARPDLAYVGDRISKLLSDKKIDAAFPQGAGVSVNVPASQSKKALGILADAVLKEHLPIELFAPNEAGDRYITISPETARKLSGEIR